MKIKSYFQQISPPMIIVIIVSLVGAILILSPKVMTIYPPNENQINLIKEADIYYKKDSNNILEYNKYNLIDEKLTERHYFFTAQLVFLKIAVIFNQIFYSSSSFDIRFLGSVYLLFYVWGIYWLAKICFQKQTTPKSQFVAVISGGLAVLIGKVSYFNSFYNYPVTLITTLYIIAACISLIRFKRIKFEGIYISLLISTSLLITNDFDNWWMAGGFFILLSGIVWMRLVDSKKRMYFIASAFLMMLISGWATYHFNNPENFAMSTQMIQGHPKVKNTKL